MRKRPRGDSRRKSRTNAATAESRNPVLASAMSADPDGSPSKTMDEAVAVIAATPSDGEGCSRHPPRLGRAKAGRRGHHDLRHRGSRPGPGLETVLPWRLRHG